MPQQGMGRWHPFIDFTSYKQTEGNMIVKCSKFLEAVSIEEGNCKCLVNGRALKCNCLKVLDKLIARDAIVLYMVTFYRKSKQDQQLTIMDWLRCTSQDQKIMFCVPFLNPYEQEGTEEYFIDEHTVEKQAVLSNLAITCVCKYAVSIILDWGRRKLETCFECLDNNMSPSHGLCGKRANMAQAFNESCIISNIVQFFEYLKEPCQPQSTRIMRFETGVGLRDGEEGWNVTPKKNSKLVLEAAPIANFEGKRKFICSWPYFHTYCRPADGCTKSHLLCNRLRYVRFETCTEPGADSCFSEPSRNKYYLGKNESSEEGQVVAAQRKSRGAATCEKDVYAPMLMEPEAAMSANNTILLEGSLHVNQAADQRKYVHGIAHGEQQYCLVVDYCQDTQLPNLGATQPGDTLNAFAYHEGIRAKGGDNVVSMIVTLLKHKGWLKEDEIGGKVSAVLMDNCGGQNKNNHVLQIANLLVEAGYFKKAVGTNDRITIHSVTDSNFKHYKRLEDMFYKELKTGDRVLREAIHDFVLLDTIGRTGIKEIKQIELYSKWHKLVPAEFTDIICPYRGDEVMRKFKEERN
eukprot:jgi/Psemu1/12010/gm1.12010_g